MSYYVYNIRTKRSGTSAQLKLFCFVAQLHVSASMWAIIRLTVKRIFVFGGILQSYYSFLQKVLRSASFTFTLLFNTDDYCQNCPHYIMHWMGTWWRSWLRHCVTSQKVAGSIPDGVSGIFHWHDPSGRNMALGSTQPLTEMSTRNISWGVKAAGT